MQGAIESKTEGYSLNSEREEFSVKQNTAEEVREGKAYGEIYYVYHAFYVTAT